MLGCRIGIINSSPNDNGSIAPDEISNLQGWFDAQDSNTIKNDSDVNATDGQRVKTWQDKSGNNRHLTHPIDASRPEYKTTLFPTNKPCLHFTGDELFNGYAIGTPYFTIVSVYLGGGNGILWTCGRGVSDPNFYPNWDGVLYLGQGEGAWAQASGIDGGITAITFARYVSSPNKVQLYFYNKNI